MEERCDECGSRRLEVVNIREVRPPARAGDPQEVAAPVMVRKVEVRCRRCGWSDFILRRVAADSQRAEPGAAPDTAI
ncbi:hypothetical protein GobsT_43970 [Gemmata obscuriglobus]|uniref:hypothetical protein n=1 Tax=Gemmata obscuriglobus TaxID=114 RepID=UPI0011CD1110|nr:hypothetical protein [Gemmata obscuriglobus]QEG29599.1 hypothetical protein GobsT_43970 [Gemmata obscuriglobus]VTS08879.1 unnamed protein product [Gemmata obscuriglobus UQM 2246]